MRLNVDRTEHRLTGTLDIPISKYHVHRALILAALASGTSHIHGRSDTRQADWTVAALRRLGARIDVLDDGYVVQGTGGRFTLTDCGAEDGPDFDTIDVGSSGTTLYFLVGLAALADRPVTITGMSYLRRRPIQALLAALGDLGVRLRSEHDDGRLPVRVEPGLPAGGDVAIAGTLSQWVSGLLLVAPFARRDTTVHITGGPLNERTYVDLTIRMMRDWGLQVEHDADWRTFRVPADQRAGAIDYTVPPDIGASAFGIAVCAIHPADVLFRGQTAITAAAADHPEAEFLDIAAAMGIDLRHDEDTGFLRVRSEGAPLRPVDVDCRPIPDLLPVLSTLATFAEGRSRLYNVAHIRLKESDRVSAMLQLNRLGGRLEQGDDELRIVGSPDLTGADLSSFNDHRVLMSLAVAGTRAAGSTTLTYPRAYRISYPEFLEQMNGIGLSMSVIPGAARQEPHSHVHPVPGPRRHDVPAGIDGRIQVLTEHVRALATERPDDPAVIEVGGAEPVTTGWGDLQRQADRVSALLMELGVQPGEAVAMQIPNWVEFVAIAIGITQIGALVTPIMPVFGPHEVAKILTRSQARVVFVPNRFRHHVNPVELVAAAVEPGADFNVEHVVVVRDDDRQGAAPATSTAPLPSEAVQTPAARHWTWRYYRAAIGAVDPDPQAIAARAPQPEDACQLLFTSGTTGEPKGVLHSNRALALATALEVAHLGLGPADRIYVPTPMAHQTGFLYGLMLSWRLGVPAVIQPVWDAGVAEAQAFGAAGATFVQAATPFLSDLVKTVRDGAPRPDSLRIFVATGAAVPRSLAKEATDVLDCAVLGAFGSTESCLGALGAPSDPPEEAWGSDGRALPGIRLRIRDDDGREVPAGQEGNFEIDSPTLFLGYLERPDLTAEVITDDGWYRTGDLARLDEHGFLHISGRVKDVINRGGEKIPVVEIENLLYQHPDIADVAIVAMPDPRLGERACAFVVPQDGRRITFAAMQHYLGEHGLSKYYWPERLEFIAELPRNTVGKVQKNVLREQAKQFTVKRSA
jgi:3-phosphoshikimate 1-carboxyvinyltransferase